MTAARGDDPAVHDLTVTHDRHGRVDSVRFGCAAAESAPCRVYPACACESWTLELHGDPPEPGHEAVPQPGCWMEPWFSWGGPDDVADAHDDRVTDTKIHFADDLRTGPVAVEFQGDHITWRYTDERQNP